MTQNTRANDTTRTRTIREMFYDQFRVADRLARDNTRYFVVRGEVLHAGDFFAAMARPTDYTVASYETIDFGTHTEFVAHLVRYDLLDDYMNA